MHVSTAEYRRTRVKMILVRGVQEKGIEIRILFTLRSARIIVLNIVSYTHMPIDCMKRAKQHKNARFGNARNLLTRFIINKIFTEFKKKKKKLF